MASNAIGGGAIDAEGFLKYLLHFYRTGYTKALNVTQRAAGANMSVDVNIDSSNFGGGLFMTTAGVPYFGYTNAAINATVATADPTNPRRDIVVAYIDLSLITTGTTNNLGAFKVKVVTGTAAASPSDPNAAAIQASVGAGNPYIQLARVSLTAALGSITNAVITDLRTPAANAMPYLYGGSSNTVGHLVPNLADGTVVVTSGTGNVSTAMIVDTAVTNAKLAANAAWSSWTPTWTNLTIGNATVVAAYQQIGKTIHFRLKVTLGTTSSVGSDPQFSLPVTASAGSMDVLLPMGMATYEDVGTTTFHGVVWGLGVSRGRLVAISSGGAYGGEATLTATAPYTFTTGDILRASGSYEAA